MPAVSTAKQDATADTSPLDDVYRFPASPSPSALLYQHQFDKDAAAGHTRDVATPRCDVIVSTKSRDEQRATSGTVTSADSDTGDSSKVNSALTSSSSAALVSSPETGWRAISGYDVGGLWDRRATAPTSVSSPADGAPADASMCAASPIVGGRTPLQTCDSGTDPLATLMRLYGALSDSAGCLATPDHPVRQLDNSPAASLTPLPLPVVPELSTQGCASNPSGNDDYIVKELTEAADYDDDGPAKSYICHVCQYIGTSRSQYLSHMSEHFKHRCTLCGYMTSYAGRLKRHLEDCHTADDERPAVTQRKPALKRCRKCGFESTNLKLFYDHVRTHIRPERILECPTASCPFVTEYRHHLELHLRNHLNSRPIRCPICPYRCAVSSMLASHLKSHTKVHRFRCSVCRFSSKFSNALKRHLLEKGHGRGYVLNPDGSVPEGGAVPFEPGSPSTRVRQKVAAVSRTATATVGTSTVTSDAQRHARYTNITSEAGPGADVKAVIWTPPVAASPKTSWRPPTEQLPVKRGAPELGTPSASEKQHVGAPLLPMLTTSTSSSLRGRSLFACSVCGTDTGGYVELAQHMMTSHYSPMAPGPAPSKRPWPGSDEPNATSWTPPPRLPTPHQLNNLARRVPAYDYLDGKRDVLRPRLPAASSMALFNQPSSLSGWGSAYRSPPPMSTSFASLSSLRSELDAVRSSDGRSRVDEMLRRFDYDRGGRVKSANSEVVDVPPAKPSSQLDYVDVSPRRWHTPGSSAEQVSAPVPLDLSSKTSMPQCDQLLRVSGQVEAKRSRRKGRAFKVDADRVNSAGRGDDDLVGRYSGVMQSNSPWHISDGVAAAAERTPHSGEQVRVEHGFNVQRDVSRSSGWPSDDRSDEMALQKTASTSARDRRSASAPYHECRHCGLGFRDGELFAMHMDFHGRRDPFTCNFCGAATRNQVEFFLHVAHAPHNVRPVYVM